MSRAPGRVLPVLLVLVALMAGWQTVLSARSVLGGGAARGVSADRQLTISEEAKEQKLIARARHEDSLLVALDSAKLPPDPFRPRPVVGPPRPPKPVVVPEVETPVVILSAFDKDRPEVVLGMRDKSSGRLTQGAIWEGWTIVLIDRTSVELSGFGKTVRISVPNQM